MKRKESKIDYKESMLPSNRRELFADIFKLHWRTLLVLALLLFLGLLPFLACLYFRDNIALSYSLAASKGEISEATRESAVRSVYFYASLGQAASLYVFAIVLSGVIRIIRQLMWLEPVFFKEDFKQGIKDNYKYCAISFIFVAVLLIGVQAMNFTPLNNVYLIAVIIGVFIAFILPPLLLTIAQGSLYSGSWGRLNRNGVALYLKHAPSVLLLTLFVVSPFLLELIQNSLPIKYICMGAIAFIIPIVALLVFMLNSYSLFDIEINKDQYPEIYRKGLYGQSKKK